MGIGSRIRNQLQQAQQQPQQPQQQGTPQSAFPQPMGGKGGIAQRIPQQLQQQPSMHRQSPLQPQPMGGKGGGVSNIARQMPIDRTQQPPAQMGGKGAMQGQQPTQAGLGQTTNSLRAVPFQEFQSALQGQQAPAQMGDGSGFPLGAMQQDQMGQQQFMQQAMQQQAMQQQAMQQQAMQQQAMQQQFMQQQAKQAMHGRQFTPDPATIFPMQQGQAQQPLGQAAYPNQMGGLAALLQNQQTGGM